MKKIDYCVFWQPRKILKCSKRLIEFYKPTMSNSQSNNPSNEQQNEQNIGQKKLPRELSENLSRNVCVCYDVPKQEIIDSVLNGAKTVDEVSNQTYACQGSGCCVMQVEKLIKLIEEHKEQLLTEKN